jgi:hypothetical protein
MGMVKMLQPFRKMLQMDFASIQDFLEKQIKRLGVG